MKYTARFWPQPKGDIELDNGRIYRPVWGIQPPGKVPLAMVFLGERLRRLQIAAVLLVLTLFSADAVVIWPKIYG
jgi:hypothetical protein